MKIFPFLVLVLATLQAQAQIVVEKSAIADSYIYQAGDKADLAYGVLDPNQIISRTSVASAIYTREAYCMFDISDQSGTYSKAQVLLYGNVVAAKTVDIYYTDASWDEATLTGNNRPLGTYISSTLLEAGTGTSSWDVTHYLNEAVQNGSDKVSFVFKDVAEGSSTDNTKWHSKENSSGNAPKLILTKGDPPVIYRGNYYIDQLGGNDENSGHTPDEAWQSLENLQNLVFLPGDSLLFKSGCEWTGSISPKGSGTPGKPIVIGKYGGDVKPIINGAGLATNTISFVNQHHIVLRDLAITNLGSTDDFKRGVSYLATDMGEIRYIVFTNLEVYDVNGTLEDKDNGGIFLEISGTTVPTWFDTLEISYCHVYDVNRTGISNRSYWDNRTIDVDQNWTPSLNVHIHHNTFERTGQNALIVRAALKPLMEYNLFDHCSILGSGNASFSFNTDSALWQYNEACFTKFNEGDNDAGGFDSDYRAFHTIFQYNYSHDNEYGGILITGGPGSGDGFNDGTIVRYNIFENNKHHIIRTSGNVTNTSIYNNVFYTGPGLEDVMQLYHKAWGGGSSDGTSYWNNIFYNEGINSSFEMFNSTNNDFLNNVYFGNPSANLPPDPVPIYDDPLLADPGGSLTGPEGAFQYQLTEGSPAIDRGIYLDQSVISDYAGNALPFGSKVDIGAFEYIDTIDTIDTVDTVDIQVHSFTHKDVLKVFPNPVKDIVTMELASSYFGNMQILIYDIRMSLVANYTRIKSTEIYRDEIDLNQLEPGLYFVQVNMNKSSSVQKLIRQ